MEGRKMTQGPPWRHIVRFALPVLAGSLLQQLYNTVDTIIVGNYASESALAAVGTTGSLTFMFLAIAMGFSAGNGIVVSQYYGAGDKEAVRRTASTGILMLMGMGLFFTLFGIGIGSFLLRDLVRVPESILSMTLGYYRVYLLGLLFQYGYNIFSSILRALGDSAATLYFLLISSLVNIALDLLFVAGFHWGVAGAAAATDIAQMISFIAAYLYMSRRYPLFRFALSDYVFERDAAQKTIRVGFPVALQLLVVAFGLTFIQRAVNSFGKVMTASFTVGQRIEMYLNLPCNAFQTTLATYTGQNIGAGKTERVREGTRQTLLISLGMTLVISLAVWLGSSGIVTLFGLSDTAADYCVQHLTTVALINIVLSLYVPLFGVFQGANHALVPTLVATTALSIRVLVTYLFKDSPFFGHTIIWWNGIFGFGAGFLISWCYYLSGRWKQGARVG